ncbi:hypothetical protein F4802DRAFT_204395 [Xylaria palmicola]|nr:hypothetical protein F4802DRAFT_204395 [Xylaria palmicola]
MEVVPPVSNLEVATSYLPERLANPQPELQVLQSDGTGNLGTAASGISVKNPDLPSYYAIGTTDTKRRSWLLVAAVAAVGAAVVVGAALGGGLGASLSSCRSDLNQCQSSLIATADVSTSSLDPAEPTTINGLRINYQTIPRTQIYNLSVDCAMLSATPQQSSFGEFFNAHCSSDAPVGPKIDKNGQQATLVDVGSTIAYSLADCLQACSGYTLQCRRNGFDSSCGSVSFGTVLGGKAGNNCFLKNSTVLSANLTSKDDWIVAIRTN